MGCKSLGNRLEGSAKQHRGRVYACVQAFRSDGIETELLAVEDHMTWIDLDYGMRVAAELRRVEVRRVKQSRKHALGRGAALVCQEEAQLRCRMIASDFSKFG